MWIILIALSSGSGIVVGSIGSVMMASFKRTILDDIGLEKLPDEPEKCYQLISEKCHYVQSWTKLDSYNISIFLFGMLFLLAGIVVEFIEAASRRLVTIDVLPFTWIPLLLAAIFITISVGLILSRFSLLIRLSKGRTNMRRSSLMDMEKNTNKKKKMSLPLYFWLFMIIPVMVSMFPFLVITFGTTPVISVLVIYTIAVIAYTIWTVTKQKRLNR
ncbi:hypothetical protein [Brevibacillus laterosporus]|uniref:hypothetical protein n=1 Tax=Brevibacillus laterosporus TaxID=1465 RepID=UPI000E6CFF08|nr:hypothetical protein [Brevibacillus laterosporus]AYB37560.1 hypothetical protein D5F52_04300 [Brevibacillus laterosporus]MBM7111356.1 hypothetical protein [Brevibacillus laterosporus]